MRDAEAAKVAKILGDERPQTIALVLAHLPPQQAGNVLVHLAPKLQVDVIHRLADLDRAEPEILRDVEEALEARLSEHIQMQDRRVAGLSAVTGMLKAAGVLHPDAGLRILGNLGAASPLARQLADRLAPKPLDFAELVRLDDATLATVLEAAGGQLVTLALVGAPAQLCEHLLDRIPQLEAAAIRGELNQLGPHAS